MSLAQPFSQPALTVLEVLLFSKQDQDLTSSFCALHYFPGKNLLGRSVRQFFSRIGTAARGVGLSSPSMPTKSILKCVLMSNDLQQLLLQQLVSDSRKSLPPSTSQFVGFLYSREHLKSRCQCCHYHSRQETTSLDVVYDKMPFLLFSDLYLVYHSVSFMCPFTSMISI